MPPLEELLEKIGLAPGPRPPRLKPRLPLAAVQVAPGRISAVRLAPPPSRKKGADPRMVVAAHREVGLPPGVLIPTLTRPHLLDAAPLAAAVEAVLGEVAPTGDPDLGGPPRQHRPGLDPQVRRGCRPRARKSWS